MSRPRLRRIPFVGPGLVVVLLVLGLLAAMAIEPTVELMEQQDRIERMTAELREIEATNERLERRIQRLDDPDFLEQKAREQIGLVRPGETAYLVVPPGREGRAHSKKKGKEVAPPPPPDPGFVESLLDFVGMS
ncbi:MAG TPA: septum formation initiator family protein [Actinomycetota bacterium]|nr:septum formation initiator family protein [Actinomycetota bacterium]